MEPEGNSSFDLRFDSFSVGSCGFSPEDQRISSQWTNRVNATDVGVTWYLNTYTRVIFDWNHSAFGTPVIGMALRGRQKTNDLWLAAVSALFLESAREQTR